MIECPNCRGTGQRLARLTPEQDFAFAERGQPIPKVACWICDGDGQIEGNEQKVGRDD